MIMNLEELMFQNTKTIIDVREPWEFMVGNVPGSINIPLGEITASITTLKSMEKPIILCGASGNRSNHASRFLQNNGIKDAFNGGSWTSVGKLLKT